MDNILKALKKYILFDKNFIFVHGDNLTKISDMFILTRFDWLVIVYVNQNCYVKVATAKFV